MKKSTKCKIVVNPMKLSLNQSNMNSKKYSFSLKVQKYDFLENYIKFRKSVIFMILKLRNTNKPLELLIFLPFGEKVDFCVFIILEGNFENT